jgi:hypothetical protein
MPLRTRAGKEMVLEKLALGLDEKNAIAVLNQDSPEDALSRV